MGEAPPKPEIPKPLAETISKPKPEELIARLRDALKTKEEADSLYKVGDLLYETFKSAEYPPEIVLSAVKEVYDENESKLKAIDPKITLNSFIKSFGTGLIKLCQQKLVESGKYLGDFGKERNGVDGKLGPMSANVLKTYYTKMEKSKKEKQSTPKLSAPVPAPVAIPVTPTAAPKPIPAPTPAPAPAPVFAPKPPSTEAQTVQPTESDLTELLTPYKPGTEKGILSPTNDLTPRITKIYDKNPTIFKVDNLHANFGKSIDQVQRFIRTEDPYTKGPITFLGRTIKATNLMTLPFLKIAEAEIRKTKVKYQPAAKDIGGFHYRGMKVNGKETSTPSFHKVGLAFDIDASENDPTDGRGNIPDQVVLAMVKAGFAWGNAGNPDFPYLGNDPMHFQLRFPPDSPAGQAIINASPIGKRYWKVIEPMLANIK